MSIQDHHFSLPLHLTSKYIKLLKDLSSLALFFKMKFLLATIYLLVAAVSAVPAAQETCEHAADNCSNLFTTEGCSDQTWSEYSNCVLPVCGSINDTVKNAAHAKGC